MDERTLTALEGSIKKWEAIASGNGPDYGYKNCPLCIEFIDATDPEDPEEDGDTCFGCPVSIKTEQTGCDGTPYNAWSAIAGNIFPTYATTPQLIELAECELEFLKSLLPVAAS